MPPRQHRKKDAKVEGRDLPDETTGTMETFRALTKRLLKVKPEELAERQRLFDEARTTRFEVDVIRAKKSKKKAARSKGTPHKDASQKSV